MKYATEIRSKHNRRVVSVVALAILSSTAAFAENQSVKPYRMGVIENEAYGHSIQSGRFAHAIKKIGERRKSVQSSFSAQNNLCVSYVKTRATDKAAAACDAAIAEARSYEKRAAKKGERSFESQASRSELAMALSNRGVLRAVTGNAALAEQDFKAAIRLDSSRSHFAKENLRRLSLDSDSGN